MNITIHANYVTVRFPQYGSYFLRKFVNASGYMYKGSNIVGEVYCQGNGWQRIYGNVRQIAVVLKIAYFRFCNARNAEIRARLLLAQGAKLVQTAVQGPFVKMTLIDVPAVTTVHALAEKWGARCTA